MADPVDIRVMVPRVGRALEGAGAPPVLTGDAIKDLTADAIAEVILYTGGVFGHELVVTDRDDATNAPTEYATDPELTLSEQSVIATQAALNYFFHEFSGMKVSERIADEAQSWEYSLSANLLVQQLKLLISERDKALAILEAEGAPLDAYESFLAVRDAHVSQMVEPWVSGAPWCGQEDFRFGTVG